MTILELRGWRQPVAAGDVSGWCPLVTSAGDAYLPHLWYTCSLWSGPPGAVVRKGHMPIGIVHVLRSPCPMLLIAQRVNLWLS